MKIFTILTAVVFSLISLNVFAQFSDTLQIEKDAMLREYGGTGDNVNYGDYKYLNMHGQMLVTLSSTVLWSNLICRNTHLAQQ